MPKRWPTPKSKRPPDPDRRNERRANEADIALKTLNDQDEALVDLLTNLMHWADFSGEDFEDALRQATHHYEAETHA